MKPTIRPIRVVEPQMEDVHHASFNAALLHCVALAFPTANLTFEAFPDHLRIVQQILAEHATGTAASITWEPRRLSPETSLWSRWRRNASLIRRTLAHRERTIFSSISRMQLLQLKRAMTPRDEVRVILHGDLDQIESPTPESFPRSLFALRRVLHKRHPRGLRYILLSDSIRQHLPPDIAAAMQSIGVIDHPYHFPTLAPTASEPPIIGTFGNTGDGRLLEAAARATQARAPQITFSLIGFLSNDEAVERLRPWVQGVTRSPISRALFVQRASEITHALWLAEPGSFRLRASGTFFDALAYAKPLIYTANPYIDGFHPSDAGIGLRCDTLEDVPHAILQITAETEAQYVARREAIRRFRVRFSPEHLATGFPQALDWN